MKTAAYLYILCLFMYKTACAQSTDTTIVDRGFIKKIFNVIKPAANYNFRLNSKPKWGFGQKILAKIISTDAFFEASDLGFIQQQMKESENFIWDSSLVDSAVFIRQFDIDSIFSLKESIRNRWTIFRKIYGVDFYDASIPYFTRNRKVCIIYVGYYCGELCGEGAIRIYNQNDGKWQLYRTIGRWVS